jgi:uncharacterized protein (TIGR02246 family)
MPAMTDHESISSSIAAFGDALNRRDANAVASLFVADAEFVNIFGMRMRGREGIEAGHRQAFNGPLANARVELGAPEIRGLGSDAVVCLVPWTRSALGQGLPPGEGIFTMVLARAGGGWAFLHAHNTQRVTPGARG